MNRSRASRGAALLALLVAWVVAMVPGFAHAQIARRFALRGEVGAGPTFSGGPSGLLAFDGPQLQAAGRLGFNIVDWFSLQLSASNGVFFASGAAPNGRTFALEGGARFEPRVGRFGRAWIDGNAGLVLSGNDRQFGFDAGVGFEFAVARWLGLGPAVRVHVLTADADVHAGSSAAIFSAGVSFTLRLPTVSPRPRLMLDRDADGILDGLDLCPDAPRMPFPNPDRSGCPLPDTDADNIPDPPDACPTTAGVASSDPARHGCPVNDLDGDGVLDAVDVCPSVSRMPFPNPDRDGCPLPDTDADNIPDPPDACPTTAGVASSDPARHGCPVNDLDGDGVLDAVDVCPSVSRMPFPNPDRDGCPLPDTDNDDIPDPPDACPTTAGVASSDPARHGCPVNDLDGDGVLDAADLCPAVPRTPFPDPVRSGCPLPDADGDEIPDPPDACPTVAGVASSDPLRHGCPLNDLDRDGVVDVEDRCPNVSRLPFADPARLGCPLPDTDHDLVPEPPDACPGVSGVPSMDPARTGCPNAGLRIVGARLLIAVPVFFNVDLDTVAPQSFAIMESVADVLRAASQIRHVSIEGHTDNTATLPYNIALSQRRAASVMAWLIAHGISATRLEAHGYGSARPVAPNGTVEGRARNRRVEFLILDRAPAMRAPAPR